MVYKILTDKVRTNKEKLFQLAGKTGTRGHKLKLLKSRSNKVTRTQFFTQRVVEPLYNLPSWVVESQSTNAFKNNFDKHMMNTRKKDETDVYDWS